MTASLPERTEPVLPDPGLTDLTRRDWIAIAKRAVRESLDDGITDAAAALAYYLFLAIPAALLLALGLFGLLAGPEAVETLVDRLGAVIPSEATTLVRDSLDRLVANQGGSVALLSVGAVLTLWASTGAMTALMRALNRVGPVADPAARPPGGVLPRSSTSARTSTIHAGGS